MCSSSPSLCLLVAADIRFISLLRSARFTGEIYLKAVESKQDKNRYDGRIKTFISCYYKREKSYLFLNRYFMCEPFAARRNFLRDK